MAKNERPYYVQGVPCDNQGAPLPGTFTERRRFATKEERAAWIKAHPEIKITWMFDDDKDYSQPAGPGPGAAYRPVDRQSGGSRSDYRLAGILTY